MAARKTQQKNNVRLIGGLWRGRKIAFLDAEGLRPTPDRIRETLFNWLQAIISGAVCVDCFAGSGALGFEAASRGAQKVILVDSNPDVIRQLQENKRLLNAESVEVVFSAALNYLQQSKTQADIFFLDPPFASHLLQPALDKIVENDLLKPGGFLYLEYPKEQIPKLPAKYSWHRQKQTGDVGYGLILKNNSG